MNAPRPAPPTLSTRKALAYSFLDRYAGLLLSIGASMALARLLTPTDIGVFSVTAVLLSFVSNLRDMGAGQYLLQEKELTADRVRATWTVQLGLGLLFAFVVAVAAWPAAAFYREPRMVGLMLVMSLNFAATPFGSLTYVFLMREMRFDRLALMRFVSGVVSACLSIWLAWTGHGPYSLAIGSLCGTIANAALGIYFRPRTFPWLPGLAEVRRVLSFGSRISLSTVVNSAGAGAPDLLLGKLQSLQAAGLYSRANGLASIFHKLVMDAVLSVAIPLLSKANRERADLEAPFVNLQTYVTAIGWPFMAFLAIYAQPITHLLYGSQWDASVGVLRFLAAGMALLLPGTICSSALNACGAAQRLVRTTVVTMSFQIVLTACGAWFGLLEAAQAFVAASLVASVLWLRTTQPVVRFRWRRLVAVFGSSAFVALAGAALPLALTLVPATAAPASDLVQVALGLATAVPCCIGALFLVRHPASKELTRAVHGMTLRRRGA